MNTQPTTTPNAAPDFPADVDAEPLQSAPEQAEEFDRAFAAIFGIRPGALR